MFGTNFHGMHGNKKPNLGTQLHMMHFKEVGRLKMGRTPKTQIFHGSGPNPSHWDPSIWFWPLGWSKKSEFWSSLKLPCYRAENLASKIVSLRPHFWEFWRLPDHFGILQMRPFLCPKHNVSKAMVKKWELPQVFERIPHNFYDYAKHILSFEYKKSTILSFQKVCSDQRNGH